MKEYILFFRMNLSVKPSSKKMNEYMIQWQQWLSTISSQDKLAPGGNHLSKNGVVLKTKNEIQNGPYKVKNEAIAGYIILSVKNKQEALKIAKACPILTGKGTSVEVREIAIN